MALPGIYTWAYGGGSFPVCLRQSGVFYCAQYSSAAKWNLATNPDHSSKLSIDWKNYGQYELKQVGEGQFEGSQTGKPNNWRKMAFLRPFNDHEMLMMGGGGGSVWNFEWEKGAFEVEFRCDGYNHFICKSYPAHSHWGMEDNKILVNWDKYGKKHFINSFYLHTPYLFFKFGVSSGDYELVLDAANKVMAGCKKGEPANWRKLQFIRSLDVSALESVPSHDTNEHVHGEHCNH